MIKQGTLLSELRSIVGKKHAREPGEDCAVDGLSPQVIVEPGTYEETADVLRFADAHGLGVIPRGGGRQLHLGNIPSRYNLALSLARLDGVVEHEPADLTVTCRAGMTAGALGAHLAPSGQMVPLILDADPADPLTMGGLLAVNSGQMRVTHGSPRDFTIGMKVITADGRITRTGGKVVKNVAGYDLGKLYIGSHGTLAVIIEATFKLYPRPEAQSKAAFEFAGCADACEAARNMFGQGLSVAGAQVVRTATGYALHLAFAGQPMSVERSRQKAEGIATGAGGGAPDENRLREGPQVPGGSPAALSVRARMLPTQVPEFIRAVEAGPICDFEASPLLGEVMCICRDSDHEGFTRRLRQAASDVNGNLLVEVCPPELKRRTDVFSPPPPSFPLMRAIKQRFDPNNILSPGRFVGRL